MTVAMVKLTGEHGHREHGGDIDGLDVEELHRVYGGDGESRGLFVGVVKFVEMLQKLGYNDGRKAQPTL